MILIRSVNFRVDLSKFGGFLFDVQLPHTSQYGSSISMFVDDQVLCTGGAFFRLGLDDHILVVHGRPVHAANPRPPFLMSLLRCQSATSPE